MHVADIKEILVHWDAGEPVSAIARSLGYSRPTVRKYIHAAQRVGLVRGSRRHSEAQWEHLAHTAMAQVAQHRPRGVVTTHVAAYHTYIAQRIDQVRVSVLYQRLRDEHHLAASWGTFYRYVRAHWPDRVRRAPRVTVRLDDPPPGNEAQVDFFYVGPWFDPEVQRTRRLYAFLMTLSYSRHQFLYPVLAEDLTAWLDAHVAAFTFFGGVPKRLVPDNLTAGIRKADRYDPRLNRAYGELTRYYGCLVDPSRVAHPQDKPRVERGVSYARESFFRGRHFASLAEMRAATVRWSCDVAGQRIHGTTGQQPLVAFHQEEQTAMLPLPPQPWQLVRWTTALVHADCHLQAHGVRYSVPYQYVGQQLEVRLGRHTVEIYTGTTLVAAHLRAPHGRVTRLEHYPASAQAYLRATPEACHHAATALGPATAQLIQALLALPLRYRLREAQAILRLADTFADRLESACQQALAAGDGRYRTVRGILERGLDQMPPETVPAPQTAPAFLRGPTAYMDGTQEVR
jgi:transposase